MDEEVVFDILLLFVVLLVSISCLIAGICLRRKIRIEFVYLMVVGGSLLMCLTLMYVVFDVFLSLEDWF